MRISIKVRSAFAIILIVIFTAFLLGWSQVNRAETQNKLLMQEFGRSTLDSLAFVCKEPLLNEDTTFLKSLVGQVAQNNEVLVYMLITDRTGKIIVHNDLTKCNQQFILPPPREILDFSSEIFFQDFKLGTLHMGMSLKIIHAELNRMKKSIILLTSIITFVGIILASILGFFISKPISKLVDGTKQIGKGNFSYRVPVIRNDEIGDLSKSFNSMVDNIERDQMIKDAFGRYIPPEIAKQILENPSKTWMKGEKRIVSVFFADIRDFTKLSQQEQPENVTRLLNDFFTEATQIITDHKGLVDKFMGDAIMSVFSIPFQDEYHADHAVEAAISLQRKLESFNLKRRNDNIVQIEIGVGIASGEVIAGNLGSSQRMEYTVIGEIVNLASRLTKYAKGKEILISQATYNLLKRRLPKYKSKTIDLKGIKEPVEVYNIDYSAE
ncbi:MAG: hypothetical protein A2161_05865 [Candidatus Schekmanbacteria bacterium RBG_13_48_7]|uniref:Adenylate cyclase n=1 Tax=Candidatus Schekmanbacteria bacterium RBG_13_48_7 TaxID=1817878 RepID=A0A1F7RSX8_9BACT|nr:MAG: hypothetical protein A2161_05865 [Candidatus Schekmanbacteria bacterium RBG_13_48_7]